MNAGRWIQRPNPAKKRSRRLRKKLHLGEFQRLGFAYDLTWAAAPSTSVQEAFLDAFVGPVIEARDLCLGGGCTAGFIEGRRANPAEADRQAVQAWLSAWPGITRAHVGPLQDAWYDPA